MNYIHDYLLLNKDEKYAAFTAKLIPNIDSKIIIGVRLPVLRAFAKELVKKGEYAEFLNTLPHTYHEENMLHVCILSVLKDFNEAIGYAEAFLPYIDNWAVCDSFNPKSFRKNKDELLVKIKEWIISDRIYTKRFAIDMLMSHFLEDDFDRSHLNLVSSADGDDYYLKMVVAWYFATALAKQYDEAIKFIENKSLEKWTHNKMIQKAIESYRITDEQKIYLRSLKIK